MLFFRGRYGGGKVNAAGWADTTSYGDVNKALSSPPFSSYLGYSFRIDPHVSTKAMHYKPKVSGSTAVPCSFNFNGLKYPTHALSKERLAYNGCFEQPTGVWTTLKFSIKRVSDREADLKMKMGDVEYTFTHKLASAEEAARFPKQIDCVLIEYPNSRDYTFVEMAPEQP